MPTERIHRALAGDGTEIAGGVHGQGPLLVLVHGQTGDGDLDWAALLSYLIGRFTCSLPSARGRGLSGEHPDLSPAWSVEDVIAFDDGIGEQVVLFGAWAGGVLAFGVAGRTSAVAAVVAYEPPAAEALGEQEARSLGQPTEAMARAVTEGRMTDAMRGFVEFVGNDDEVATLRAAGYVESASKYAPTLLKELTLETQPEAFSPTGPSILSEITAPGPAAPRHPYPLRWFTDAISHVAAHVADATAREIPGAGHGGPLLESEAVADELASFLVSSPAANEAHTAAARV